MLQTLSHAIVSVFVSFQSNRASADPLLPQWRPVPRQHWVSLRGDHALSPCVAGALPAASPSRPTQSRGPRPSHFPVQRERQGTREGAASVQWRGGKRRWRKERGRTGAPNGLKEGWERWLEENKRKMEVRDGKGGRGGEEGVLFVDWQSERKNGGWTEENVEGGSCQWMRKLLLCEETHSHSFSTVSPTHIKTQKLLSCSFPIVA